MTLLQEILDHKRREVERARARIPSEVLAERARSRAQAPRGLRATLRAAPRPRVIAELKRRSPSRGLIRAEFDPVGCAKAYEEAGAAAISVLTDARYFGGELAMLEAVGSAVQLPLLRKDFVLDPYQVDEARAHGADAVLLIVSALDREFLAALRRHAAELGLDALVEVHDEAELEIALEAGADLVGINNRDLRTFQVDLAVTERLAPLVPEGVLLIAESGIFGPEDVVRLEAAGAHGVLVGEALMREPDLAAALRRLRGAS